MSKWKESQFVQTWGLPRITAVQQTRYKNTVHQRHQQVCWQAEVYLLRHVFSALHHHAELYPLSVGYPRHGQTPVQIAVCSPEVTRHTTRHHTTSGFSTSLFLFPYNGIRKEKLWVNLLHFQIIWLRRHVRLFQTGRFKTTNMLTVTAEDIFRRVRKIAKKRLIFVTSVCLSVCWSVRPSVRMDKSAKTGPIFMKFCKLFFENLSRKFKFV
jgi:hypothetical protein